MKQVKLAALVAAIIVVFSVAVLAIEPDRMTVSDNTNTGANERPGGIVRKVTVGGNSPSPAVDVQPQKERTEDAPAHKTQTERSDAGKPGKTGRPEPRGPQGRQGPSSVSFSHERSGKYTSHNGVYREMRSWDLASCSYVDAKDQHTLDKANIYAKGLLDGREATATEQPHDYSWLWWLLALLVALFLLGRVSQMPYWDWTRWFRPKPRPQPGPNPNPQPEPIRAVTGTNSAEGRFRQRILPTSTIKCLEGTGKLVGIQKAVKDLDGTNTSWQWAPAGGTLNFSHTPGGRLRFQVSFVNWSTREIPVTPGMTISDLFALPNYHVVPGSGRVGIGTQEIGKLDDTFVNRLISGEIRLDEIIDVLPARTANGVGRLNLVYEADEVDESMAYGGGGLLDEEVTTPMFKLHPEAEPVQPTPIQAEETPAAEPALTEEAEAEEDFDIEEAARAAVEELAAEEEE